MTVGANPHAQRSRFVITPDGLSLRVLEWNANLAPTCVLLHGTGDGAYVWEEVVSHLPSTHRVLAIELRGHGESQWDPRQSYLLRTYLSDVLHILDHLNVDQTVLVGHSMGGAIGLHLALERPDRLRGLVVVDFGPDLDQSLRQQARAAFLSQFRTYANVAEYATLLEMTRPMAAIPCLRRLAGAALRSNSSGGYELRCDPGVAVTRDPGLEGDDLMQRLPEISCPTLLVRGQASALLSLQKARQMILRMRSARLVSVENAGHAVVTDNPLGLARPLAEFAYQCAHS